MFLFFPAITNNAIMRPAHRSLYTDTRISFCEHVRDFFFNKYQEWNCWIKRICIFKTFSNGSQKKFVTIFLINMNIVPYSLKNPFISKILRILNCKGWSASCKAPHSSPLYSVLINIFIHDLNKYIFSNYVVEQIWETWLSNRWLAKIWKQKQ